MSEAARDREIRALRERYAHGDLTSEELDDRLDALFAAQPSAELDEQPTASGADLDAVERHLSPGERIEWVGRPDPAKHFTRGDVFLVPFSIMWGGFAIVWETLAIGNGDGVFFALWGPPVHRARPLLRVRAVRRQGNRKRRTIYAVTNRRVLTIVRGRRGESVEAMYLRSIPSVSTSAASNGRGSVLFGSTASWYANSGMELFTRGQTADTGIGFYDIEDAPGVADLVERLRDAEAGSK
jgi:hypothetical protein